MFVKICGTTNAEDVARSVAFGADALGFIFAPSKRRVTAEQAAALMQAVPERVARVGVFVEAEVEEIARTVRAVGLSAVQMHWGYRAEVVEALRERLGAEVALWQVVGFAVDAEEKDAAEREFAARLGEALRDRRLAAVLLDAVKGKASGGLGEALPWTRMAGVLREALAGADAVAAREGFAVPRVVLAGGLRAENVREAIATMEPWGVDVVSGVEAGPGRKSPDRLRAFFAAAHGVEGG